MFKGHICIIIADMDVLKKLLCIKFKKPIPAVYSAFIVRYLSVFVMHVNNSYK